MRDIRGSELSDFLKDRFTWKLRWLDKLVPNKPQTALLTGTLVHKFLEELYNTKDLERARSEMYTAFEKLSPSEIDDISYSDLAELLDGVTRNYFDQWRDQDENWKVIATELTFRIPLDDEIAYTGTIDLIYLDENNNLWIADHKTTKSIEGYEKNALLDRQISRYIWAVQQLAQGNGEIQFKEGPFENEWAQIKTTNLYDILKDKTAHGFLYNLMLKEVPQPPKQLKKGGLSKDKSQHTTWKLYLEELVNQNIVSEDDILRPYDLVTREAIPEEYREICDILAAQETEFGNRYFKRVPVFRLQAEVDASMQDFYAAAQDLIQLEKEIKAGDESRVYMNITKDTSYSAYQPIIAAVIEGSNVDLIKNNLYHIEEE